MSITSENVVYRRNKSNHAENTAQNVPIINDDNNDTELEKDADSKYTRLTLMEDILLLGFKDREGYTSFWNDRISVGLRGCFLIELALRGRISLESPAGRRRYLLSRNIVVLKNVPTGDMLLDEALRTIANNEPADVKSWIDYLSGETWNPFKILLQMKNVRERLAKNLVEKGVCSTEKQNFVVFDMTIHPLVNKAPKQHLIQQVNDTLLSKWTTDVSKMDKRSLSLVMVAHRSDILENAFTCLSNEDYNVAMKHIRALLDLNYNEFGSTGSPMDVIWAVFAALSP